MTTALRNSLQWSLLRLALWHLLRKPCKHYYLFIYLFRYCNCFVASVIHTLRPAYIKQSSDGNKTPAVVTRDRRTHHIFTFAEFGNFALCYRPRGCVRGGVMSADCRPITSLRDRRIRSKAHRWKFSERSQ